MTTLATLAVLSTLLAAALHDLAARTVPNAAVAAVAAAGLVLGATQGWLAWSLAAAAGVLLLTALLWRYGCIGGGDAKLLPAACLAVPPHLVLALLLAVSLAGGLLCLPYLFGPKLVGARRAAGVAGARPARLLPRLLRAERWRLRRRGPLPYAVAIAAGATFTLLSGG